MENWFDVNEKLPSDQQVVLICEWGRIFVAIFKETNSKKNKKRNGKFFTSMCSNSHAECKYWMPLPIPPDYCL